jgi:hypothetical protein
MQHLSHALYLGSIYSRGWSPSFKLSLSFFFFCTHNVHCIDIIFLINIFQTVNSWTLRMVRHSTTTGNRVNLHEALKAWRKRTADELQKPLFNVLKNCVVDEVAMKKPTSLAELAEIKGVGPSILQKFGRPVLNIVQQHIHDDDHLDLQQLIEANKASDTSFWATFVKPPPKKKKKAKPGDAEKAAAKRRKRIEMLSESAAAELKWPTIEYEDLNSEQQAGARLILEGNNVFLTGSAGTGKTFLLRYVIQELQKVHGEGAVAVIAPTGIAAINIGGQTIHSFAGIGLGNVVLLCLLVSVVSIASLSIVLQEEASLRHC